MIPWLGIGLGVNKEYIQSSRGLVIRHKISSPQDKHFLLRYMIICTDQSQPPTPGLDECEYEVTKLGVRCSYQHWWATGRNKKKAHRNLIRHMREEHTEGNEPMKEPTQ